MTTNAGFCKKCNKFFVGEHCRKCNSYEAVVEIPSFVQKPLGESMEVKSVDSTLNWIGPIQKKCNSCGANEAMCLILPPPSPDQPNLVKYRCLKCGRFTTDYKN